MKRTLPPLVLASGSPRRQSLLRQIGLPFIAVRPKIHETSSLTFPLHKQVENLALQKAQSLQGDYPDAFILGADTVVSFRKKILGKPSSIQEAVQMLHALSGRTHQVVTGVALIKRGKEFRGSLATKVWFRRLPESFIRFYVKTGEPMDKAGAYAIQGLGALCVKRIEGDYFNVVGLPLILLFELLKKSGFFKNSPFF